jgi:hypothetical protein
VGPLDITFRVYPRWSGADDERQVGNLGMTQWRVATLYMVYCGNHCDASLTLAVLDVDSWERGLAMAEY